jgi:hypothetical protein
MSPYSDEWWLGRLELEFKEKCLLPVMDEAMWWAVRRTVGFHLSMDMDFVDPNFAPGVGTPVQGGPTYRESHLAMEKIADSGKMLSFELAEVNPVLDTANLTAELGDHGTDVCFVISNILDLTPRGLQEETHAPVGSRYNNRSQDWNT